MTDFLADHSAQIFFLFLGISLLAGVGLLVVAWRSRRRRLRAGIAGIAGVALTAFGLWLLLAMPLQTYGDVFALQNRTGIDLSSYTYRTVSDGEEHQMSEFNGKPVLLYYWSTTCGPCRPTLPVLEELARDFEGRAKIVSLSYEDRETLLRYAETETIPGLGVYSSEPPVTTKTYTRGLPTPTTFLIDRQGVIRKVMLGARSPEHLRGLLERFAEPPA